jgi:CRISPR-associated protein Cmr3
MTTVFIEPCDIVFFRDDLPFGDQGSQVARCQFPPRPSVIAGALRTRLLVDRRVDFDDFAAGRVPDDVAQELGRARREDGRPTVDGGTFRLAGLWLGRARDRHRGPWFRAGRDLVAEGKQASEGAPLLLAPSGVPTGVSSVPSLVPLAVRLGSTPVDGWLGGSDYARYLAGHAPPSLEAVVRVQDVLAWDHRVGIGMDTGARTVDEGRLFSSRGAVLREGWGFVATVEGCSGLPASGLVRLGGDGRMARLGPWAEPEPDWSEARAAVVAGRRFRWVLQTPAIFDGGWRPGPVRQEGDRYVWERDGFRARLVSAAVAAPELAGGWDLVRRERKPFRLMVPAGSVYFFEIEAGTGEDAWRLFHGQSVSDERANEGFGIVHAGGWSHV